MEYNNTVLRIALHVSEGIFYFQHCQHLHLKTQDKNTKKHQKRIVQLFVTGSLSERHNLYL